MLLEHVAETVFDEKRILKVREVEAQKSEYQRELDIIANLAKEFFSTPISLVSLVDTQEQRFPVQIGLETDWTPTGYSFCAHAISEEIPKPFIVLDTHADERFKDNALVTGDPFIRFYAGFPIIIDGEKVGSFCVIDNKPWTEFTDAHETRLREYAALAKSVMTLGGYLSKSNDHEFLHQRDMKRNQMAIKAGKLATWDWNLKTNMVEADPGIRDFFDIQHDEPLTADDIISQIHPDDQARVNDELQQIFDNTTKDFNSEFRIASTGRWLKGSGSAIEWDETGKPSRIGGVNADITASKLAQEKTKLLLRELNHRVKNTLAMLQSIANQTIKNSKTPEEFKKTFSGRLRGLAMAHTLLSDKEWEPIEISQLVRDQVHVYAFNLDSQINITGDEATLGPEEAVALGMVLHELATNAAKYGALSTAKGKVNIAIAVDTSAEKPVLNISWIEEGGPAVTKPERTGFGTIMIERSLDKVIGSSVSQEYKPEGLEVSISLPINA